MRKELLIRHRLIKSVMSGQSTQIGQAGMTTIKNANFCFFIGVNVLGEGDTNLRQIRPLGCELIVNHPLREIFGHDRHKGTGAKKRVHFALQFLRRARCNAINHRTRKGNPGSHPFHKILSTDQIEIGKEVALQHFAVSPNVIAAQNRNPAQSGGLPPRQSAGQIGIDGASCAAAKLCNDGGIFRI